MEIVWVLIGSVGAATGLALVMLAVERIWPGRSRGSSSSTGEGGDGDVSPWYGTEGGGGCAFGGP